MTGQIPKYGENFTHDRVDTWHPTLNSTIYVLKADPEWFIRADKTSKIWRVFQGMDRDNALPHGEIQPNMRGAMKLLLDGIECGFYLISENEDK